MREHKYRAWSPENKVMIYFDLEKVSNDHYQCGHLLMLLANKHPDGKDLLTEYIGIKDNNCKEIYEGDIVQYFRVNKAVGTIIYNDDEDGGGCFMPKFLDDECHIWYEKERWYNLEVVGNIYENPELLEVTNAE